MKKLLEKIRIRHLQNKEKRISNRRQAFNARIDKKATKITLALRLTEGEHKYLNWKMTRLNSRRKYYNVRADARLAMIAKKLTILDDENWSERAERAVRLADKVIDRYDDALMMEESACVFRGDTIFGKCCWVLVLAVIEMALWLAVMCFLGLVVKLDLTNNVTLAIAGIVGLVAIAVPLDIMFSNSKLFDPFLKLKVRRMRLVRDEMSEYIADCA